MIVATPPYPLQVSLTRYEHNLSWYLSRWIYFARDLQARNQGRVLDPQITIPITWSVVRAAIWRVRTDLSGLSGDLAELYLRLQFFTLHTSPTNLHSTYPFGVRPPMLASLGFPRMPVAVFTPCL